MGEHDYYLDLGEYWSKLFGPQYYSFDHKGVHFVVLNSILTYDDWTHNRWPSGAQRMSEMAGLDNRYVLHGEEEYEYFAPVLAGDVLTCKARVSDAYEKAGKRGGKMIFVVFEFTYFNQRGEKALVSRSTLIQTGGVVKE
jgi:hypothetical protein